MRLSSADAAPATTIVEGEGPRQRIPLQRVRSAGLQFNLGTLVFNLGLLFLFSLSGFALSFDLHDAKEKNLYSVL